MSRWKLLPAFAAALLSAALLLTACGKTEPDNRPKLRVETIPENAELFFSGKPAGKAPFENRLAPGVYLVKAELPGYEPLWRTVRLEQGKGGKIQMLLQRSAADALLRTEPVSGADVTFNGRRVGQTPLVLRGLVPGKYSATVKAPGCAAALAEWEILSGRPVLCTTRVYSNTGKLRIHLPVRNSTVYLDGKLCGSSSGEMTLEQGDYELTVKAPGYGDFSRKISVGREQTTVVTALMNELPVKLRIRSTPEKAFVTVNGREVGTTPVTLEGEKAGTFQIRLTLPNYEPVEIQRKAESGQTLEIAENLISSLGNIEFVTVPPGVTVYFDGNRIAATEPDPKEPGISAVFRLTGVAPGKHQLRFFHKFARPTEKSMTVTVGKNETLRLPGNVTMWIANARIVHKDGSKYIGRLVFESPDSIKFEHEPGLAIQYKRSELRSVEKIEEKE